MRATRVKADSANGITVGDYVRWKVGYYHYYGDVQEIYLSFKYPRGLKFWSEPTITVATMFIIRDTYGIHHHIPAHKIHKVKGQGA